MDYVGYKLYIYMDYTLRFLVVGCTSKYHLYMVDLMGQSSIWKISGVYPQNNGIFHQWEFQDPKMEVR